MKRLRICAAWLAIVALLIDGLLPTAVSAAAISDTAVPLALCSAAPGVPLPGKEAPTPPMRRCALCAACLRRPAAEPAGGDSPRGVTAGAAHCGRYAVRRGSQNRTSRLRRRATTRPTLHDRLNHPFNPTISEAGAPVAARLHFPGGNIMRSQLLALGAGLMLGFSAAAASAQSGDVAITNAWARATPGGAQTAAAYVTVESVAGDRLTGAATPAAQKAEIHLMTMDDGVMKMRQVDGVDLPPGKAVTLKPGGYHIMLTGIAKPLEAGQSFPLTLDFAKAGARQVTVTVEKVGAMGPGAQTGGGMNMPGMDMPTHH